ncbi:uncharacterized protein BO80DRAFT_425695 [Aspergillus ibericus CBS 121593]|uniref:Uncharacterized protein n=1 Tax=Aspergillus ibericus CBS 121593 TaxID=1448316 RepID=A0A395GY41_9EURO|nr:hypothetical protein BO80DRAFT_425695 [Aspergillus ibericus CBS 121593]RAL00532.1 hypothetical protein BO80DRAFT_425695 [Aspergillus ibericus CBS 121593]
MICRLPVATDRLVSFFLSLGCAISIPNGFGINFAAVLLLPPRPVATHLDAGL